MPNLMTSSNSVEELALQCWQWLPDDILIQIFSYLSPKELLRCVLVCQQWLRVGQDEYLWKDLFYRRWKVKNNIQMAPGKTSWYAEFKRLHCHIPEMESETIKQHKDQVLHVSFSNRGDMFATSSKDGFVKVWNAEYPVSLKYYSDMKDHTWKYTQFTQFNKTDTLLLVSGVHFGSYSTSGEIAIFNLQGRFELQSRVPNKPYDIFGTWYNERYLLSGNLHWMGQLTSCSVLWLNNAYQILESEQQPVMMRMYKFHNVMASSVRTIMIANCVDQSPGSNETDNTTCITESSESIHKLAESVSMSSEGVAISVESVSKSLESCEDKTEHQSEQDVIKYCDEYRLAQSSSKHFHSQVCDKIQSEGACGIKGDCLLTDKYLIFTTGQKTYTPHQIGIKRIKASEALDLIKSKTTPNTDAQKSNRHSDEEGESGEQHKFDKIDHLVELHGHIIGMSLSPDHRYLYVNSRQWPKGYHIEDPLYPPPIASEIDIHVIDLLTVQEVGTMHRAHKAYTPNDECFFIFLDVCEEYVASGAEDKHGYLWDRHYGMCLTRFPHDDVVNSVAFNPADPEMLVTVSDDDSIKVWRSRTREQQVKNR